MKKSTRLIKIALFVFILASIVLLLRGADFQQIQTALQNIDYVLLSFVFVLGIGNVFLMASRWYVLLKVVKSDISFKNVMIATIGATAINASGPGKVGIPAKALLIKKLEGVEVNQSIPSVLLDIFLEIATVAMVMLVSGLLLGMHDLIFEFVSGKLTGKNLLYTAAAVVMLSTIGYFLHNKLKASEFVVKLKTALRKTMRRKEIFLAGVCLSIANQLVFYWGDYLLFKALQQEVPFGFVVFSSAFAAMAGWLSPLPSGAGVWEISRAYLFKTFYGIGEIAVIMTLLRRLLTYLGMGVIYLAGSLFFAGNKDLDAPEALREELLETKTAGE
jgi:uncharacterized membrane protein YbhN (UPF0104 family)